MGDAFGGWDNLIMVRVMASWGILSVGKMADGIGYAETVGSDAGTRAEREV